MLVSLSQESLIQIAVNYRRQQRDALAAAESHREMAIRADGAALAIEHLVKVCFEAEPQPTIVIEEKIDEPAPPPQ